MGTSESERVKGLGGSGAHHHQLAGPSFSMGWWLVTLLGLLMLLPSPLESYHGNTVLALQFWEIKCCSSTECDVPMLPSHYYRSGCQRRLPCRRRPSGIFDDDLSHTLLYFVVRRHGKSDDAYE